MKKYFYGFETKAPPPTQDLCLTVCDILPVVLPSSELLLWWSSLFFRWQFLLSRAWEVEMETRHSCMRDPRWKFFLFYVNRDWWNILHRVRAFDKKYWWLLSVSVTWDDRMSRFKMNYRRNSLFGNVIHFTSSLVLWEWLKSWRLEMEPFPWHTVSPALVHSYFKYKVMGEIFILANDTDQNA